MSRLKVVIASAFLLIFPRVAAAEAQPDVMWVVTYGYILFDLPPYEKSITRWKWQAAHADPRELARMRVEAARVVYAARQREFLAGRGTLEFLSQASLNLLESERAVAGSEAEQIIALEKHWALVRMCEDLNRWRYAANRIPIQDYMRSKYERLRAEIWLIEATARSGKRSNTEGTHADWVAANPLDSRLKATAQNAEMIPDLVVAELPSTAELATLGQQLLTKVAGGAPHDFNVKQLAQARFDANGATLEELTRAKVKAAQVVEGAREREFLSGRGDQDFLFAASLALLDSERVAADNAIDQQAALERYCARANLFYDVNRERFEVGRLSIRDVADARYKHLESQIWLAEGSAKSGKVAVGGVLCAPQVHRRPTEPPEFADWTHPMADPLESREFARAKFEAMSTDARTLAQEKFYAANASLGYRFMEFLAGRGTLDFLVDTSRRLMESELALRDDKASHVAAIERHWLQCKLAEDINWERYVARRILIQDCAGSLHDRLKVELRLIEAKK
jgi:hypothetical protein